MDDLAAHLKELESTRTAGPQDSFAGLYHRSIFGLSLSTPFIVTPFYG
ncbi:hypothetical protein ACCS70_13305 [Rhizobium ruizarguesonis]|jgi:hypothetical protein|uniref:Uncharacterized protein n=1 Tax=Rhizobium ruizarguesonis TaxID=2081791 RepID=A0AAE4YPM8_9HYPH|nr:hypothetical protein [Rhizobium ruizarguesonis]MBY5830583.1 hypothetical protein [Rhizobium leguminosarum]QIO46366.1 hypothetical protein HA464_21535 [Rhizobium leguminosarum bv. trifolii]QJS29314.1 hypothetical protein RLTA1_19250 [Rhizobium leguminosarum bv. trifolii TA1]MBY5859287.1 hypothetical protein [Rhizobium leguminosarum]MBY5874028.1 hypothetical protein [Rhizobium leguminosarum]